MKLSVWAKQQGISYRTAWEWFKDGTLPVPARQLSTGTILVEPPDLPIGKTVVYARVSSHDQKPNLDGQVARCVAFANQRGLAVSQTITEVGSGLNGHRKKLLQVLRDQTVTQLVVEHRDRLMRFGAEPQAVEAIMSPWPHPSGSGPGMYGRISARSTGNSKWRLQRIIGRGNLTLLGTRFLTQG